MNGEKADVQGTGDVNMLHQKCNTLEPTAETKQPTTSHHFTYAKVVN